MKNGLNLETKHVNNPSYKSKSENNGLHKIEDPWQPEKIGSPSNLVSINDPLAEVYQ